MFCTYVVVLVTLVGQGLTFAPLLRRLRLGSAQVDQALARNQARLAAVEASLVRLNQMLQADPHPEDLVSSIYHAAEARRERYRDRIARLSAVEDDTLPIDDAYHAAIRLQRAMIDAERQELLEWRDSGRLPDTSLRELERELDHRESVLPHPERS